MKPRLAMILWRKRAGASIEDAASILQIKPRTIRAWESGQRQPGKKMRERLRQFGIEIGDAQGE